MTAAVADLLAMDTAKGLARGALAVANVEMPGRRTVRCRGAAGRVD
jgi:hypothetical protein